MLKSYSERKRKEVSDSLHISSSSLVCVASISHPLALDGNLLWVQADELI